VRLGLRTGGSPAIRSSAHSSASLYISEASWFQRFSDRLADGESVTLLFVHIRWHPEKAFLISELRGQPSGQVHRCSSQFASYVCEQVCERVWEQHAHVSRGRQTEARTVETRTKPGYCADGGGLYLKVSGAAGRSWVFRYRVEGRLREMGLGSAHTISLADARQMATECRKQRLQGIDPIDARRNERTRARLEAATGMTFRECAERYIAAHRVGWRNAKHAEQWRSTLAAYAFSIFGDLSVKSIDLGLVMKAIEPIWATKTETASRLRGRIENILDWGDNARLPNRRQPGPPAGTSRQPATEADEVLKVQHLRGASVRPDWRLFRSPAAAERRGGPGAGVLHSDRDPHLGDDRRAMGRSRFGRGGLDDSGGAYQGGQGAHGPVVSARYGHPAEARGSAQ
jgi:integrase-like protein/Arm domain-containing DNA-binding protein